MEEVELLKLAKQGNTDAFSKLLAQYECKIKSLSKKYSGSNVDRDDLLQESFIAFSKAVECFDQTRNIKFSTFAQACVRNALINCVRKSQCLKNTQVQNCMQLDDDAVDKNQPNPETIALEKERDSIVAQFIDAHLTDLEKNIVDYKIKDYSAKEIANLMNLTTKSVDNALQRAKAKLRKALKDKK